jgi:hypothetical protein
MQSLTQILQEKSALAIRRIKKGIIDNAIEESIIAANQGAYYYYVVHPDLPKGITVKEIESELAIKQLILTDSSRNSMLITIKDPKLIKMADDANREIANDFIKIAEDSLIAAADLGHDDCKVFLKEKHFRVIGLINDLLVEKNFPPWTYTNSGFNSKYMMFNWYA